MRLLFVIRNYGANDGPTEKIVESISNELQEKGVSIDFLTLNTHSTNPRIYVVSKTNSLLEVVKSKLLHRFLKYPYDIIYTKKLAKAICKLNSTNSYDFVIPVIGSVTTLLSCKIASERKHILFVPYFTDIIPSNLSKIERECLNVAYKIIENCSHKKIFSKKHESLLSKTLFCEWPSLYNYEEPLKLNDNCVIYTGSFYKNIRNESQILNLARYNRSYSFYLVGSNIKTKNIPNNVFITDKCDQRQVNRYISSATYLLNIENNNPNQLPSKLINYICSKKKIINLKTTDINISSDYLIKTNSTFCNITEKTDLKTAVFQKDNKQEIGDFDKRYISKLIFDFLGE